MAGILGHSIFTSAKALAFATWIRLRAWTVTSAENPKKQMGHLGTLSAMYFKRGTCYYLPAGPQQPAAGPWPGELPALGRAQPCSAGLVPAIVSPQKVQFPWSKRLGRRAGGRHVDRHIIQNKIGYLLLGGEEKRKEREEGEQERGWAPRPKGMERSQDSKGRSRQEWAWLDS